MPAFLFLGVKVSDLLEERRGKNEILEGFILRGQYLIITAFPGQVAIVQEGYIVPDLHHGVHIMGIDDSRDIILDRDIMDQLVDHEAGLGIKS